MAEECRAGESGGWDVEKSATPASLNIAAGRGTAVLERLGTRL